LDVVGKGRFSDSLLGSTAQFNALTAGASTDSIVTIDASGNLKRRNILNYINGTTGYVPYYTSSTSFGNSPLYYDGFRIGVGTTAPGGLFANTSTINVGSNGYGASPGRSFLWSGSSVAWIGSFYNGNAGPYGVLLAKGIYNAATADSSYIFEASSGIAPNSNNDGQGGATPIFDVLASRKVGINNKFPTTTLHVENPLKATTYANADAQVLRLSRPTLPGLKWDNIAQFNLGSYSTAIAAQSRLDLALTNGGNAVDLTNVMTWQANGNVGIGTTAPTNTLDVNGELRIRTATAGSIYTDSLLVADATGVVKKAKYITPGVKNLDGAFSTYTIALSDMGGIIIVNSSIDVTITVPTTLPAGFTTQIIQKGTGKVTMVNAVGLSLSSANGYNTRTQFSAIGIVMASSTEGYITGDSSNL
jgi:hypothetical protein